MPVQVKIMPMEHESGMLSNAVHLHERTLWFGGDCIRTCKLLDSAPASVVVQYAPMTFDGKLGRPLECRGASITNLNNLM